MKHKRQRMNLKGLSLSVPVCDWRPLLAPHTRIPFPANPTALDKSRDQPNFIKGFGPAGKVRFVNVSWWPKETVYFDCSRRLASLWESLSDGNHAHSEPKVTHVIRRVYLDGMAMLRFEIAIYTNCVGAAHPAKLGLEQCGRRFLTELAFKTGHQSNAENRSLIDCLANLVDSFTKVTANNKCPPTVWPAGIPMCKTLEPELQVLAECREKEIDDIYEQIGPDSPIRVRFSSQSVSKLNIATAYVVYPRDFITHRKSLQMKELRQVRRAIRWKHANLEVLRYLLETIRSTDLTVEIEEYLRTLAEGLSKVPDGAKPLPRVVEQLMAILDSYHENTISDLVENLRHSSLSDYTQTILAQLLSVRSVSRYGTV